MNSSKREFDYFDSNSNGSNDSFARKRKRKSRFSDEQEKVFIPGLPTIIPSNLSKQQEEIYILQLQIESLTRRLLTSDWGIPDNVEERSPSPEPIYNSEGKRLNTREFRMRRKFEDERHSLITKMLALNSTYKPPADYKPPQTKINEKVLIPQDDHPDINFVGLIIGPRGNTLKGMERDTGAKIIIRGKGSVKEGKLARKDGQPLPGEDEPLHAFVTGPTQESVMKAVQKINEVIQKGIELPENMNDLRRSQLRELALLNGTLRENDGPRCTNCGANNHRSWQCPDKPNITNNVFCTNCNGVGHLAKDCKEKRVESNSANKAKIDEEYLSLMAELGEAPALTASSNNRSSNYNNSYSNHQSSSSSSSSTQETSWAGNGGQAQAAPLPPPPPPPPVPATTDSATVDPSLAISSSNITANTTTTPATTTPATAWANYYATGSYDPYAYAQAWDPSAWASTAAAATTDPTSVTPAAPTAPVAGYGYDANQWSQYAQWYASSMAAGGAATATVSATTPASVLTASSMQPPPPPPPPIPAAVSSMYAVPPPPPPPPPPQHN